MGRKSSSEDAPQPRIPPSPQIKAAAEKLLGLAYDRGWTIEKYADEVRRPFQTLNNWLQGHTTAMLETMEPWARVVDATLELVVRAPGEEQAGGLRVDNRDTFVIAQMVDGMSDDDREWWRKRIEEFVQWKRSTAPHPTDPAAADSAPRARSKTGTTRK